MTFPGGEFTFSLSEVINPLTTAETQPFGIKVVDNNLYELYEPPLNSYTLTMLPSDFAFAFVTSDSNVNGRSSLYQISLTLSVDSPPNTIARLHLPNEIKFDESKQFTCKGTQNLQKNLDCTQSQDKRSVEVQLTREKN